MTDSITPAEYAAYREADAEDRRAALEAATQIATDAPRGVPWPPGDNFTQAWLGLAEDAYTWLRARPTLAPHSLKITPGTPQPEPSQGAQP